MGIKDKLHVMVVDDMSVSRGLILQALDWMGIQHVDYCVDGESALRKLAARPVHLVISDYNMPGMDGLGLLEGLRKGRTTQRIGFILITGSTDSGLMERGNKLGMNNYIKKPFSPEALKACIERVVGRL
ncbi:response regulator [Marinibacterium sp. SX1]|uniref:response regulator n=1 Tax=Marinibacterium sp. SX1 TaxID=3388424 RepID=UPI003D1821FB|tara:strand:+ start:52 stop:438 length:387 start_codon:yes stop_codon:yes gene_type:complete